MWVPSGIGADLACGVRCATRGGVEHAVVVALCSAAGPTIAAAVLAASSWRWLFAMNVPIGLLSLLIGIAALPRNPAEAATKFDWRSGLLNAVAFAALFLAVDDLTSGHAGLRTAGLALIVIATGVALVRRARGSTTPLIPIDLLRVPLLRVAYATSVCALATQMIGLVALPFYLEQRFGYGQVATGLLITGFPVGVVIAAPFSGRLAERSSGNRLGAGGLILLATGFGLIAAAGSGAPAWIFGCLMMCGIGMGLFQSPNNKIMLGDAPRRRSGAAAGMMAISRILGQTLGALVAALVFRLCGTGSSVSFAAAAGFGIAAAFLSTMRRRSGSKMPAQGTPA